MIIGYNYLTFYQVLFYRSSFEVDCTADWQKEAL